MESAQKSSQVHHSTAAGRTWKYLDSLSVCFNDYDVVTIFSLELTLNWWKIFCVFIYGRCSWWLFFIWILIAIYHGQSIGGYSSASIWVLPDGIRSLTSAAKILYPEHLLESAILCQAEEYSYFALTKIYFPPSVHRVMCCLQVKSWVCRYSGD